jgi:hypothetical protein
MTTSQRYTAAQVADALDKHKGMVYLAADALGCSHQTVYNYAKRYKSVQEAIDRNRGQVVDTAELALYNAILNKEHWAIAFALKTIGKRRGYTQRQEYQAELMNIDLSQLTEEQLIRVANGEDPAYVLATASEGGTGETEEDGD